MPAKAKKAPAKKATETKKKAAPVAKAAKPAAKKAAPAKKTATKAAPKAAAKAKSSAKKAPAKKPAAKKAAPAPKAKPVAAPKVKKAGTKAGPRKVRAEKPVIAKKIAAPKKAKTKKVKVTQKAAREAESRLKWNPTPVEGARWYVVQTASNYEKRVQSLIREQLLLQGMQRFVEDVVIPMEPVVEVKKGQKVSTERKFFPGYVLIKCVMNDNVWHLIRHTPHVSSFMGADHGRKPLALSTAEAERILTQMQHGAEKPRNLVTFEVGEEVRVMEGPFANFTGMVEGIDEEKERLTVAVSIFGRATPIELDFNQVEKA